MVSTAVALLALLVLPFALVQSVVMQAGMQSMAQAAPICGERADSPASTTLAMAFIAAHPDLAGDRGAGAKHHHRHSPCPFCSVAAHMPVVGDAPPLRLSADWVFTCFLLSPTVAQAGPSAPKPRARGPPSDPLTA